MRDQQLTDPMLGPAIALVELRREHPEIHLTSFRGSDDGTLTVRVATVAEFEALDEILGRGHRDKPLTYDWNGRSYVTESSVATWRDVRIHLTASIPVPDDTYAAFAETHNPDPQQWPASERQEFADFAIARTLGQAVAA